MSRLSSLWRNLVHRDRVDRELDDEMRAMFNVLVDEKVQAGVSPEEARRAARLELGGVEPVKQQVREERAGAYVEALLQDIRYGARSLRRTPGFTLAAITTLALGIGANAAIFTLLDAVIFKPLPVRAPEELVSLYENAPEQIPDASGGTGRFLRFSYPRFKQLQAALGQDGSLVAATRNIRFAMKMPGTANASPVICQLVSGTYFPALGIAAARGRLLTADDERMDATDAVGVISDRFWKTRFGGDDSAVGRSIVINDVATTVVGIAAPGFVGTWTDAEPDLWVPLTLQSALQYSNNSSSYGNAEMSQPWVSQDKIAWLNLFGRVPAGQRPAAVARLQAANQPGVAALAETYQDPKGRAEMLSHTLVVKPFANGFSGLRARFSDALLALTVMVAVLLLVTCANIANLLLARAAGRARDVAIRISLGATRGRLIRQCLTESTMLALLGGGAGLVAGELVSGLLAHQVTGWTNLPQVFSPDSRVLVFTAGLSLFTAVLFGLAPALLSTVAGAVTNQRQAIGQSRMRGMRPLVAGQLALSVVVVFGAILLGRTLINFTRIDPGFAADKLVYVSFDPRFSGYSRDQMLAAGQRLIEAAQGIPGVKSVALSTCGLVANCSYSSSFKLEGTSEPVPLQRNWVGAGYFSTVGVTLVEGREFTERDSRNSARVAVITESIARRYFAGLSPVGKRLGGSELDHEIIGVVREARTASLRSEPTPMLYFPIDQAPPFRVDANNLEVRAVGKPADLVPALREAIRRTEPALLLNGIGTMADRLAQDVNRERIVAYLVTGFAGLALLLSTLGLYSVLSYAVARRTQEIGVRMALGARMTEVVGLVLTDALKVVGAGIALGVVAALASGRLLKSLLFDVSASDPIALVAVLAILTTVMLAAAFLPARRAARIDPVLALRGD